MLDFMLTYAYIDEPSPWIRRLSRESGTAD